MSVFSSCFLLFTLWLCLSPGLWNGGEKYGTFLFNFTSFSKLLYSEMGQSVGDGKMGNPEKKPPGTPLKRNLASIMCLACRDTALR